MIDAWGSRSATSAFAYGLIGATLDGVFLSILYGLFLHRELPARYFLHNGRSLAAGAACALASYVIAMWAMALAPVALVAAVRETNILFAVAIGIVALHEPLDWQRLAGCGLILLGLVTLRLGP